MNKELAKLLDYLYEIIKNIIDENKYKTVLDLGCESASFIIKLKNLAFNICKI